MPTCSALSEVSPEATAIAATEARFVITAKYCLHQWAAEGFAAVPFEEMAGDYTAGA